MLWLALLPSRADRGAPAARATAVDLRFRAGLLGVAAALAIAIPTVLVGVYLRRMYSAGLFLGMPFTIGYISAYVFNARGAQSERHTMQVALLAVALAGGAMLVFALEGAVCVAMAFPIAALLALPGAILGRAVALRSVGPPARAGLAALLAPLVVLASPRQGAPSHEVVTAVAIDAPPAVVWRHVVTFPERSEEHTSELQSHSELVCRLLLEKKKRETCKEIRRDQPGAQATSRSSPPPWLVDGLS